MRFGALQRRRSLHDGVAAHLGRAAARRRGRLILFHHNVRWTVRAALLLHARESQTRVGRVAPPRGPSRTRGHGPPRRAPPPAPADPATYGRTAYRRTSGTRIVSIAIWDIHIRCDPDGCTVLRP
eukprot:SAG31_NODE_1008_length_10407_cov_2.369131_12_plen_125_part_00